jgi:PIN domain nuclease of toxin-antitoxin system
VLDASALLAYLRAEPGADAVEDLLTSDEPCMAHAVSLCEVYYKLQKYEAESEVRLAMQEFKHVGLVVRTDLDEPFWLKVGNYKAAMRSVSLADCFVVALANRTNAPAVTADHPDFELVGNLGLCQIKFIR